MFLTFVGGPFGVAPKSLLTFLEDIPRMAPRLFVSPFSIYSPGNIPWGISPGECYPRNIPAEFSPRSIPGEFRNSWRIFLGEYSQGIFPGNISIYGPVGGQSPYKTRSALGGTTELKWLWALPRATLPGSDAMMIGAIPSPSFDGKGSTHKGSRKGKPRSRLQDKG